jgi:hypothetical protein
LKVIERGERRGGEEKRQGGRKNKIEKARKNFCPWLLNILKLILRDYRAMIKLNEIEGNGEPGGEIWVRRT